jgi:hypothetical protein
MLMHEYMDVLMLLVMLILHVSKCIYEYINVVINVNITCQYMNIWIY